MILERLAINTHIPSYWRSINLVTMRTRVIKRIVSSLYIVCILCFSFTGILGLQAQTTEEVTFNWQAPLADLNESRIYFEGASFNQKGLPVYGKIFENQHITKAVLKNLITAPVPAEWLHLLDDVHDLPTEFEAVITNKTANSGNYGVYEILPFRIFKGIPELIISADVELEFEKAEKTDAHMRPKSVQNSVLANGNWVKVGIAQNGLYKITFSELQSAGLIGGNINSNLLQLYGNGGDLLSEKNSVFRYDDLKENAIEVMDGGDGDFGNGDYILFYGQGCHQWKFNWLDSSTYTHAFNVYADTNFYFVTVGTTNGLRISSRASLGGASNYSTTKGDGYVFREDEKNSLTHSGRQWMGDYLNFVTSYTYNFNLPDISASDSATLIAKVAGRCVLCNQTVVIKQGSSTLLSMVPSQASSSYTAPIATDAIGKRKFIASGSSVDLTFTRSSAPSGSEAWLDYLEINYRKNLNAGNGVTIFSDARSLGFSNAQFIVSNASSSHQVWDVTNPLEPILQQHTLSGSDIQFQADMSDTLHTFVAFVPGNVMNVASMVSLPNQNLHALTQASSPADFVIVTHPALINAAQDLANFHTQHDGMTVHVVTTNQIYNEYSTGKQDISAIRDFLKMYYDNNPTDYPKYVLLFGDGSYDYKPYLNRVPNASNANMVPAYETLNSFDRGGGSYCSDDFYALLDNDEGTHGYINLSASSNIDIGVGRIPTQNASEAQGVVNKIKYYANNISAMRDWRNALTLIADDMETGWESNFLTGSESIANQVNGINPVWNVDKIYLDSYQQISNAGQRYPEVEVATFDRTNKGSLIINYIGHGGETGITAERVFQIDDVHQLGNLASLPAFCTATCTFTRFDNPDFNSAGEVLMLEPDKGAIGLYSTIRPISIVPTWNKKFYNAAYKRMSNGEMPRMGDIIRISKQPTPLNDWGEANILLFGDPALRLAYPEIKVVTDSINGIAADTSVGVITDTLMASQLITITGHIEELDGSLSSSFDGDLYTTIFDKASNLTTLGNDGGNHFNYLLRKNVIFKGKSTVKDGKFTFQFQVPLDINYLIGQGKISYYATDNEATDAHGYYMNFNVGGSENNCQSDATGPEIEIFMNDTNFVEMGITQPATTLVVRVSDENGINTTGLGIGHDLQAIIDNDIQNPIILNDYYVADNNSYQSGTAEYLLKGLSVGFHTIVVQVWDGCNNPADATLNFAVTNSEAALINFTAFPNPFNETVTLAFEHNFQGHNVNATIDITNLSGHVVKQWSRSYTPEGNRDVSFIWNGANDSGAKLASGMYIARVLMEDDAGNKASASCKLILVN